MPRNADNNTIVVTQSAKNIICSAPDSNISLIEQYNSDGRSNYFIHLYLESDPAALQALAFFRIITKGYRTEYKPVEFVSSMMLCKWPINIYIVKNGERFKCAVHLPRGALNTTKRQGEFRNFERVSSSTHILFKTKKVTTCCFNKSMKHLCR